MQSTVELTQKEKLKKFNEKLQTMLKNKIIDKNKTIQTKTIQKQLNQQIEQKSGQVSNQTKPLTNQQNKPHEAQNDNYQEDDNANEKSKKIKKNKKQSNVTLRKVAGTVWKDQTLEDWPQNDYRIFVGNLGREVNDEILRSAFRNKYSSFQMAKVVIDKRTGYSKGYGFASFKEPKDFLNVLKQMNNKYIGNQPVKITKSKWKQRALESEKNQVLPSNFQINKGKQTNKVCAMFKYVSPY